MLTPQNLVLQFDNVRFSYEPTTYVSIIEQVLSFPIDADLLSLMEEVLEMLAHCERPGSLDEVQKHRIVTWLEDAPMDGWSVSYLMDICMLLLPDPHMRAFVAHRAVASSTENERSAWSGILEDSYVVKV